jgi:hypothetical protein
MNFTGKFEQDSSLSNFSMHADLGSFALDGHANTVTIPNGHLLFSGDYERSGLDLIVSDQDHRVVIHDYFRGEQRPTLVSPEGAPIANGASLGAHGMEGGADEVIYWLSKDSVKKMRGLAGQQVEVMGKVTDVSMGTVKVRQEPGKDGRDNKVEVDARGKDATAKTEKAVEPGPPVPAGMKVKETKTLPTYRIQVDSVRSIATNCP